MKAQKKLFEKNKIPRHRRRRWFGHDTSILNEVTVHIRRYTEANCHPGNEEAALFAEVIRRFNDRD